MFQVQIPKDIEKYEAKWIGPFNGRQCVCIGIGVLIGVPIFLFLNSVFDSQVAIIALVPIATIIFPFGWLKPFGLKFEQFLKIALVSNVIAPAHRLYKTKSAYEVYNYKHKPHKWKLPKSEIEAHPEYIAYK